MNIISNFSHNIDLLVFDLDNTLYNEVSYYEQAFSEIGKYLSEEFRLDRSEVESTLKDILCDKGRSYHYLFNDLLDYYGIDKEYSLKILLDIYCSFTPKLDLYQGVRQLIANLQNNYKLGIITGGLASAQRNKINSLLISEYFDCIVITQEIGVSKPDSLPYSWLLNYLKIIPSRAVYIGDNPYVDFSGARAIGMSTIRVKTDEFSSAQIPPRLEADLVIDNIADIGGIFLV